MLTSNRFSTFAAALVVLAASQAWALNIGTTLDLYHLGEADPGAVAGNVGNSTTVDSGAGGVDLAIGGSPTYSSNVGAPGSTLSMAFNGASNYSNATQLTTLSTNVGIDAWVYPTSSSTVATIAYNGNGALNGFGILQLGGGPGTASISGLVGNVILGTSTSVPLNQWSEITQLLVGGKDLLYVNGVLQTSDNALAFTPAGTFTIGGATGSFFQGNVDEVRLFVVPEPSTFVLGALGLIGLFVAARRRKA